MRARAEDERRVAAGDRTCMQPQQHTAEEDRDGEVERSPADGDFFGLDPFNDPGGGNENSDDIDQEHFIELKDLGGFGPEEERNEEEESVEEIVNGFVGVVG